MVDRIYFGVIMNIINKQRGILTMTKLRGKAKQRARARARAKFVSADGFGPKYKPTKYPFLAEGPAQSWDASGGASPFAVFTLANETQKLIRMFETNPTPHSTRAIESDFNTVLPELAEERFPGSTFGYFMAIVPTYHTTIDGTKMFGPICRTPNAGQNDWQWADETKQAYDSFQSARLKPGFMLLSVACTPDRVWAHCETIFKYFNYVAVAYSNPNKIQTVAEDADYQQVWLGNKAMDTLADIHIGENLQTQTKH